MIPRHRNRHTRIHVFLRSDTSEMQALGDGWCRGMMCCFPHPGFRAWFGQGVVGLRDWASTGARAHSWVEFHPKGSQAVSSATKPQCGESRQLGEWFHHHVLALKQSSSAGVLPQQQSPKAYKTSLQKHPVRLSYAKSTTAQRGNSCAVRAKGAGMHSAAMGLQHTHEAAGRACPWLQQ